MVMLNYDHDNSENHRCMCPSCKDDRNNQYKKNCIHSYLNDIDRNLINISCVIDGDDKLSKKYKKFVEEMNRILLPIL